MYLRHLIGTHVCVCVLYGMRYSFDIFSLKNSRDEDVSILLLLLLFFFVSKKIGQMWTNMKTINYQIIGMKLLKMWIFLKEIPSWKSSNEFAKDLAQRFRLSVCGVALICLFICLCFEKESNGMAIFLKTQLRIPTQFVDERNTLQFPCHFILDYVPASIL